MSGDGAKPSAVPHQNTHTMYKFYKILHNGKEKYCGTFHSTLDPEYHAYINWCRENNMRWKLTTADGQIKFQG